MGRLPHLGILQIVDEGYPRRPIPKTNASRWIAMKVLTQLRDGRPKQELAVDARKAQEEADTFVARMSTEEVVALVLGISKEEFEKMKEADAGGEPSLPS